jgi:hypothetical protein
MELEVVAGGLAEEQHRRDNGRRGDRSQQQRKAWRRISRAERLH